MNDYFDRLFRFNSWANAAFSNFLIENKIEENDCIKLMSHLQLAQSNWYWRIVGQQQDEPVWQMLELRPLAAALENNGALWLAYTQTLKPEDFNNWVAYNNLAGQPQQDTIQDLLAHVVNHATYHRGQLASRIRQLGFAPPATDYVLWARSFPAKQTI